mmetsp:Transcript_29593/g.27041  ORF Transcript_29593/g.27041 Transcript_29593/m.27041 type:complete len:118 (+) Transcript_29593:134-487(+)
MMDSQQHFTSFFELTNSLLNPDSKISEPTLTSYENKDSFPISFSTTSLEDETKPNSFNIDENPYEPTRVILFKKVPYEATELDIVASCHRFGVVSDVYLMKNKGYAFVQFQEVKSAI